MAYPFCRLVTCRRSGRRGDDRDRGEGEREREAGELNLTIQPADDMTKIGEKVKGRTGERHLYISILQTGDMMKVGEKVRGRGGESLNCPSCRLVT